MQISSRAFVFICVSSISVGIATADERLQQTQVHMGTKFIITVAAPESAAVQAAWAKAFKRIEELDNMMSDYRSESEVLQLSRGSPHTVPVKVSRELFHVLSTANSLSIKTDGAFDVTVGPLSKLWRRARRRKQFPPSENLSRARAAVGFEALKLDPQERTVRLTLPNMRTDLGAIAKGFAADEALRIMRESGFPKAIVNAGGDIAAGDAPLGETGWKVGIAPLEPDAEPSRFLRLKNQAIATSGDAWQYLEIDGTRYSHIIDPRSGIAITQRSSVTVLAPTGIQADSLASAISVLGHIKGIQLADDTADVGALVVYVQDGEVMQAKSKRFP